LKTSRVRTVIVPRPDVDIAKQTGIAGDPREIFSRLHLLVTPANAEEIAGRLGKN